MEKVECSICRKPKASFTCDVCEEDVCKNCSQLLDKSVFSFLAELPEVLSHSRYCNTCFDADVQPELDNYNELMERARNVFVFFSTQKKEIPTVRRSKIALHVKECDDREETILRLAFMAAQQDFNAIMGVTVTAQKVRNEAYQTSVFSGSGTPVEVDAEKIERWTLMKNN